MTLEIERQSIQEQVSPLPTALHLFRYKGAKLDSLRTNVSSASKFEKYRDDLENSINKLAIEKDERIKRLTQTGFDLLEESDRGISSITCGKAYLKMRDELPELPAKDFIELFKRCLAINTSNTENAKDTDAQTHLISFISTVKSHQAPISARTLLDSMNKMAGQPPEWFKGNEKDWRNFIAGHSNFFLYLNMDLIKHAASNPNSFKELINGIKINALSGPTLDGDYPDWLLEGSDTLPARQEVEKELAEDKKQQIKVREGLEAISKQAEYLENALSEKIKKANIRAGKWAIEQFADLQTFAGVILFLKAISRNSDLSSDKIAQDAIQSFTIHKNFAISIEPIAIYIEKQLMNGKIVENSQNLIDDNFIGVFTSILEHIDTGGKKESSETDFLNLRTTNKKAFDVLNHRLKPFLQILSSEEMSFLKEMLAESKGMPVESLIWDIASFISDRFEHTDLNKLSKHQVGELYYLSRFTASFIKNHWHWAFEQIQQVLASGQPTAELAPKQVDLEPLQKELDDAIEELTQGNLRDWHIFYTDNKTVHPNSLFEIQGESLAQREEVLGKFFQDQHISSSVKAGSIIRTLDWITAVPQEIEQVRMTKEVAGEVFKKIKRGNLRIFYILDATQKKIIFFTHQKKAWSYGF